MNYILFSLLLYLQSTVHKVTGNSNSDCKTPQTFCSFCDNKCGFGPTFYDFIIEEKEDLAPDNFRQKGKVINGQSPGPTIIASPHQTLVVRVTNRLSQGGLSLHFHGLHQQRTLSSDGVGTVTQDDIPVNGSYTYCIELDGQMGTHFYHAHTGLDQYWVYGALIIVDSFFRSVGFGFGIQDNLNPFLTASYDEERVIMLGHLFHNNIDVLLRNVLSTGGSRGNESLLINGKSYGEWGQENADPSDTAGYDVINVERGKTYRFRVINTGSARLQTFSIQGHKMLVIEADGIFVEPKEVETLLIHVAQRYSVLVTMALPEDNYWITGELVPMSGPGNGAAILHYEGAPDPTPLTKTVRPATGTKPLNIPQFFPNRAIKQSYLYNVPRKIHRNIYLDFHQTLLPPIIRFEVSGHIFEHREGTGVDSYLTQVRDKVNITNEPEVFEIITGQGIQIIFQSRMEAGVCTSHPWHLHGRYFYVVKYGADEFGEETDLDVINELVGSGETDFEFRDVFIQVPFQTAVNLTQGAPCGWQAIRFLANNPGIWLNHCHITEHMIEGKMFIIWEHTKNNPWLCGE